MQKRQVLTNALVSAVQVVVVGCIYFVLYPFLLRRLGADLFGVWALVLNTTAAGAVANLGLAGSTVKFVAQYLARGDVAYVRTLLQTTLVTLGVFVAAVLPAAYVLFSWILELVIRPATLLPEALLLLPYALASFWLVTVGGAILSGVDGFQRVDVRGFLQMGAALAYMVLCFVLVPRYGLLGLAYAQVGQAGLLMVAAWLALRQLLPSLPWIPYRWSARAFREMLGYSVNFQVTALTQMLYLPAVSAMLSRFGSTSLVSYFELAHRMVRLLRDLIVTAHQAIVPTIADLQEKAPERIQALYLTSHRLLLFLILPSLPLLIGLTPLIAEIYVNGYNPDFVTYATILFVGWFLNILANPAYFANLGTGDLRWNVLGHIITGVANIVLGFALGFVLDGTGVVLGYAAGILIGSIAIAVAYHRKHGIALRSLFDAASLRLGLAGAVGLAVIWALYTQLVATWPVIPHLLLLTGVYGLIVAWPLWQHPARRQLFGWLKTLLRYRSPVASSDS